MASARDTMIKTTFYHLAVLTFFVSFVWVAIGMYMTFKNPVDIEVDANMLKPISPSIDMEVLESMQERLRIAREVDEYLSTQQLEVASPTPEATPEATPEPTPEESTESGSLAE